MHRLTKPQTRPKKRYARQLGLTLLEVLLSVGIMAGLLSVGSYIISRYSRLIVNEKAAQEIMVVQNAAEEFVRSNFEQLTNPTMADYIPPSTPRVITVADLSAGNYLPINSQEINSLGLRMRVWLRNVTNPAAGSMPVIEVLTGTQTNGLPNGIPYEYASDTAQFGKGKIGLATDVGAVGTFNQTSFRSFSGEWQTAVANYPGLALAWVAGQPSAYLAAYGLVSSEDIFAGNMLYRIPIAGQPNLNEMQTNLDMNNHGMGQIGTMTADNVRATGANLTRAGGGYALSTADTMAMPGGSSVTGHMAVYGDMSAHNANLPSGTAASAQFRATNMNAQTLVGNTITANGARSQDIIVSNTMQLDNVGTMNVQNLQLGSGGGGNTITTSTLSAPRVVAATTDITGNFVAMAGGTHQVVNNLSINNGTMQGVSVQRAVFGTPASGLCWSSGGSKDDVPGC